MFIGNIIGGKTSYPRSLDFSHVYREHNRREDILSKEGLHLAPGHLLLTESFGNKIIGVDSSHIF